MTHVPEHLTLFGFLHTLRGHIGGIFLYQDDAYSSEWMLTFTCTADEARHRYESVSFRINRASISGHSVDAHCVDDALEALFDRTDHPPLTPAQLCDIYQLVEAHTPKETDQ